MDRTEALNSLKTALIDGKDEGIDAAIDGCISVGMEFREIINAIQEDMCEVGVMFEKGRLFLPQMMVVAAGAQHAMDVIKPLIQQADSVGQGPRSVAMGSVLGDVHDIGKNICVVLMTSSGYQVRDLGRDVPVERFVDAVRELANGEELARAGEPRFSEF